MVIYIRLISSGSAIFESLYPLSAEVEVYGSLSNFLNSSITAGRYPLFRDDFVFYFALISRSLPLCLSIFAVSSRCLIFRVICRGQSWYVLSWGFHWVYSPPHGFAFGGGVCVCVGAFPPFSPRSVKNSWFRDTPGS